MDERRWETDPKNITLTFGKTAQIFCETIIDLQILNAHNAKVDFSKEKKSSGLHF